MGILRIILRRVAGSSAVRPFCAIAFSLLATAAAAQEPRTETIVFVRHGEKPAHEIGNLNCQGLNRALALPDALIKKFGKADYIFAPGTTDKSTDGTNQYSYIRPLITIAPTAIRLGLPVNADFGFENFQGLAAELEKPQYSGAIVFVAWEHKKLVDAVKQLETDLHGTDDVPTWERSEFDAIYVVKITTNGDKREVHLSFDKENLHPAVDCATGQ